MHKQPDTISKDTKPAEADFCFGGFKNLNCTPIPDEFFDVLTVHLSEAELRVLLYIMRRTFGFKKRADAISLSQLTGGIRRRDGSVLDNGTGLSKPAVLKAVSGLQVKGIISVEKRTGYDGRNEVNVYQLRFQDESEREKIAAFPANFYNSEYSTNEYYADEHTDLAPPDPRLASAQAEKMPSANTDGRRGQRLSGVGSARLSEEEEAPNKWGIVRDSSSNYKGSKEEVVGSEGRAVKILYQGGKQNLPGKYKGGKGGLPGVVKKVDGAGKNLRGEGVKMVDQQHGILQQFRKQETDKQNSLLLQSSGTLALQEMVGDQEPVEVEIDGDLLYINFRKLVEALVELGLSEKLAMELTYAYPEDYLWEKVELTRQVAGNGQHQRVVRNTAGYLRRAIEEDYKPRQARAKESAENFTRKFPAALAVIGEQTEEDFTEDTAPLPPIYRPAGALETPGRARLAKQGSDGSWGRERAGWSSCGAVGAEDPYAENEAWHKESYPRGFDGKRSNEVEQDWDGLWEQVREDLKGRYRLGTELALLEGSWLVVEEGRGERRAIVRLKELWQERELGLAARGAIGLALRQRLGPDYTIGFGSA
jgi:hypothetical protein